jgi:hypothetical protein
VFAWRWSRSSSSSTDAVDAADDGGVRVAQRFWIDHVPSSDRDAISVFVLIDDEHVGVFQKSSAWRGAFEVFRWTGRPGDIQVLYPQTGEKEVIRAKARRCNASGMDFCLELSGNSRGVQRYYSKKGWEIDAHDAPAAEQQAARLLSQMSPLETMN